MAIREGRWDCESCGHQAILGRELSCPKCGYRRPEGVKFYLPEDAETVTDEELIARAEAGADWICEWCGSSSVATVEACSQCGAERGTSPTQQTKEYSEAEVPHSGDMDMSPKPRTPPPPPPQQQTSPKWKSPIFIGIAAVVLLLFCVGGFLLFRTTETTATITGFSWERSIAIEKFKTFTEEGPSVPADGRRIGQKEVQVEEQVQTGTESYVCGKEDLGNGMFRDKMCDRPVYETRYRTETVYIYEIDRWVTDRTERASGKDRKPYWPRANLSSDEREGSKDEEYVLHVRDNQKANKEYKISLNEHEWNGYQEGQQLTIAVNALGHAKIVDD